MEAEPTAGPTRPKRWMGIPVGPWIAGGVAAFVVGFLIGYYRATGTVPSSAALPSSGSVLVGVVLGALLGAYALLLPVAYRLLRSVGAPPAPAA